MNPNDLVPAAAPDDLVGNNQADPVIAALLAGGFPVQAPVAPPAAAAGPITSPVQVQAPAAPPPTTPASAPASAAFTPPAAPPQIPPGAKPLASGDVRGATKEQNADVEAEAGNIANTELLKTDALAAHAESRAKIYEGHATAQGLVDEQYQAARAKARMDANAETAAWMRDLDKKVAEEPVPGRWWANQTKFGQGMYLLSLAFGAMAQTKNPNLKNIALEMFQKETEEDMTEQRDRIKRQIEGLKTKGQIIDNRLQAQLADSRDDHTLLVSRLAMIQQAALERSNAPGPADQRAAMAEAAQWAGQQRLTIAGERANRAYAEREGQLGRDSEMARAYMTDKRERDLKAAELQKDYDLARLSASVKLNGKEDPRVKDSVSLPPSTTGIRVVDESGKPVDSPISHGGGLTISKANEKEARQTAEIASDKFAAMQRVSTELGKNEDIKVLLKKNPQLVSDIVKLGYGSARSELDPNGRVTDKDFVAGLEHELGGDLYTLKGRISTGLGITANQAQLKALVDKHLRDYPKFVSHKLGSLIDQGVPGYEGNVRVDWTPKAMETAEPGNPSTQEIDASYGIKTPLKAPETLDDLANAQTLEKKGVHALPPYKPGSQDKVLKALEDFKGAMPSTISDRAGKVEAQLNESGDTRASLEVQQGQYAETKKANAKIDEVVEALHRVTNPKFSGPGGTARDRGYDVRYFGNDSVHQEEVFDRGEVPISGVVDLAKAKGLTQLTGQDVLDIIKKAGLKPASE